MFVLYDKIRMKTTFSIVMFVFFVQAPDRQKKAIMSQAPLPLPLLPVPRLSLAPSPPKRARTPRGTRGPGSCGNPHPGTCGLRAPYRCGRVFEFSSTGPVPRKSPMNMAQYELIA